MTPQEIKDKLFSLLDTKDIKNVRQALELNDALNALTKKEIGDRMIPMLISGKHITAKEWSSGLGWLILEYVPIHPLWMNVKVFIYNSWGEDIVLKQVPSEIGNLTNIEELVLRGHGFKTLPSSISNLKKLERLMVDMNQLKILPSWIGGFTNLIDLTLDNNDLISLPKEIGNLKKLQSLSISSNKIEALPKEIGNLKHLRDIYVGKGSPISPKNFPPPLNKMKWKEVTEGHYIR